MFEAIQRLTERGIPNLLSERREEKEVILQVLRCNMDSSNNMRIELSDGFCYAQGILIDDAKFIAAEKNIEEFSILRIKCEDVILPKSEHQILFELKNYEIIKTQLTNQIGYPIPYSQFIKNGCINEKGMYFISDGSKYLTIRQILSKDLIKNCSLRAKIIRKPPRFGKVMNIQIQDKERSHIQCVLFEEVANAYAQKLQQNNWYIFQNVNVQLNNKKQLQKQLKITMSSIITPYTNKFITQKQLHYGHFPTTEFNFHSTIEKKMQKPAFEQVEFNLKQFVAHNKQQAGINPNDVCLTACVKYIKLMQNGNGRFIGVMDRNESNFEILLWKEHDGISLRVAETYFFEHFRVKSYRDKIELVSNKDRTQITPSQNKINRKGYETRQIEHQKDKIHHFDHGEKENDKTSFKDKESKVYIKKRKQLEKTDVLSTVDEILDACSKQKSSLQPLYFNCYAYLSIPAIQNEGKFNIAEQRNKFFTVSCKTCKKDPTSSKYVEIGMNESGYRCKACGAMDTNIQIMWNPRIKLIDNGEKDINCRMNDQIAEKVFGMRAQQAYTMFNTNLQEFVVRAKKVHFMHQVFKINSKYKDGGQSRYFNVVDMYDESRDTLMEDIKARFNQNIKSFQSDYQHKKSEPMDIELKNQ